MIHNIATLALLLSPVAGLILTAVSKLAPRYERSIETQDVPEFHVEDFGGR